MLEIPLGRLVIILIPILIVGIIYARWVEKRIEIAHAAFRMLSQLLLVGYLLTFIFSHKSPFISTTLLLGMILAASLIALRVVKENKKQHFVYIFLSIFISGGLILAFVIFFILQADPWYNPRFIIPLAGMIFSNGMNTISLGIERFHRELSTGQNVTKARLTTYRAALIPQINMYMAVGLVSLPGMMTGQILSGVSPLIAVRYQIMVMAMLLGNSGISLAIYLSLCIRQAKAVIKAS